MIDVIDLAESIQINMVLCPGEWKPVADESGQRWVTNDMRQVAVSEQGFVRCGAWIVNANNSEVAPILLRGLRELSAAWKLG